MTVRWCACCCGEALPWSCARATHPRRGLLPMPLASFDELYRQADARPAPVPVVAAGGADRTVLEALRAARDRGWVAPAVTGREEEVRRVAREADIDLGGFTVVDTDEPAAAAVARVRAGQAGLLAPQRRPRAVRPAPAACSNRSAGGWGCPTPPGTGPGDRRGRAAARRPG